MKYFFLVIISLWYCQSVFAQVLTNTTKHSQYSLVYEISDEEAQKMYQKKSYKFLKEFSYDQPIDTVFYYKKGASNSNSNKWKGKGIGHFVSVFFYKEELAYQYYQNQPFFIHVLTDHHQFLMKIISLEGEEITDAKVFVDHKKIPFDQTKNSYQKSNAGQGVLTIEYQGKKYFSYLKKQGGLYKITESWDDLTTADLPKPSKSYGYLVLNKPKYRYGDTVKVVGYLVKNNEVFDEEMTLELKKSDSWRKTTVASLGKVSPNEEGFYTHEFVLGDSLTLDTKYFVHLEKSTTKEEISVTQDFYLEDYELQENYYEVHHRKKYFKNDTISFYLDGKTANNLPSLGAKAHLQVRLLSPQKINRSGELPFDIWEKEVTLDQFGQAEITFPFLVDQSIITYELTTIFKSATNEIIQKVSTFHVNTLRERSKEKSFQVVNREITSLNQQVNSVWYQVEDAYGKILKREKLDLPYNYQEEKGGCNYYFYSALDTISVTSCASKIVHKKKRTHDSLFFSLQNPRKLLVHYTLFEGKKIIKTGEGFEFDWQEKIKPKKNYSLIYNYVWRKSSHQEKINFYHKPHELSLHIDAPKKAIFGEEVQVNIQVQNQENEPVESVNVVSNGINKEFDTSLNPTNSIIKRTTYGGKEKLAYQANKGIFDLPEYELQKYLKNVMTPFQLDSIPYYQWKLAENDLLLYGDTNAYDIAQFAPFIYDNGELQKVHAIWVDEQPVYFSPINKSIKYSFEAPEGKHTIKIRIRKKLITIREVELKKKQKLFLFFDVDKKEKSSQVTVQRQQNRLSKKELREMLSYFYYLDHEGFVVQGNMVLRSYSSYYPRNLIGPLVKGQLMKVYRTKVEKPTDTTFVFERKEVKKLKRWQKTGMHFSKKERPIMNWDDILKPIESFTPTQQKVAFKFRRQQHYNSRQSEKLGALLISADDEEFVLFHFRKGLDTIFYAAGEVSQIIDLEEGVYNVTAYHANGDVFIKKVNIKKGVLSYVYFEEGKHVFSGVKVDSVFSDYRIPSTRKKFLRHYDLLEKTSQQNLRRYNTSTSDFNIRYKRTIFEKISDGLENSGLRWGGIGVNLQAPIFYKNTQQWQGIGRAYLGLFILPRTELNLDYKYWGGSRIHDAGVNIRFTPSLVRRRMRLRKQKLFPYLGAGYHHLWSDINQQAVTTKLGVHLHLVLTCFFDIEYTHYHLFNQPDVGMITVGVSTSLSRMGRRMLSRRSSYMFARYWSGRQGYMRTNASRIRLKGGSPKKKYYSHSRPTAPMKFKARGKSLKGKIPKMPKEPKGNEYEEATLYSVNEQQDSLVSTVPVNESYIRSDFKDYTHLTYGVTNSNGQYQYSYTLPDNITTWNSYVLAMNNKGYQGYKTYKIQVYQSVMAQLSVPRFMLKGDTIHAIGKAVNYTDSTKTIISQFEGAGQTQEKTSLLTKSFLDTYSLVAKSDTMHVTYSIQENDKLIDGEKRNIPIYSIGVVENKGIFNVLKGDTSFTVPAKKAIQTIYVLDDLTETIIREIEYIKKYPYYCNEQISSKLRVLLVQKELAEAQGKLFKEEQKIKKLIRKLVKNQHDDGSWGWFEKSESNYFITGYVALTLQKLQAKGYEITGLETATQFLVSEFLYETKMGYKPYNTLYNLATLSSLGNHQYTFDQIQQYTPSIYTQVLRLKILQNQGKSIDLTTLLTQAKKSYFGALYWGNYESRWWDNSIQLNIWMYQLLKKQGGFDKECEQITNYFLEKHKNTWRNTMESTQIIEILLNENEVSTEKSKVLLNGKEKTLPYQQKIPTNQELAVTKEGRGKVFFTSYETFWNPQPKKVDSVLTIQTHFEDQKGNRIEEIETGQIVTLIAEIDLPKSGNYWMVNVPIPSSCSYYEKTKATKNEVHREYFRDRVSVFYENLDTGRYVIEIPLQVRFEGNVKINPAKMEMMYFPTFYGRNTVKIIESK